MSIKYIFILLFSLVIWVSVISADEVKQKTDSVKTLIAKVKKAPASERRLLMNELKLKLRSMHASARKQVMLDLRHSFNTKPQNMMKSSVNTSSMNHQSNTMMNESKNMKSYMDKDAMGKGGMKNMPQKIPGKGH